MDVTVRIGAACVMTASGAWGGKMLSGAQARRAKLLQEALTGVRRLNVEMIERRVALREALSACGGLFEAVAREMEGGAPPGEAWRKTSESLGARGEALDSLDPGDMTALNRLFGSLGEGGMQAQRMALIEAAEEIERLMGQARKKQEEQGRLYTSLGALGGLAMALLLL